MPLNSRSRQTPNRAEVGRAGEEAAARYLIDLGYAVVERNWRCRSGEIDLIAHDGTTLVFIEVRSRSNPTRFGTALEAVSPRKCRQVRDVAAYYLKQHSGFERSVRFDVIAVTFLHDGITDIKHLTGAF
jgi:putative endonuclease